MIPTLSHSLEESRYILENEEIRIVVCQDQVPQRTFQETLKEAGKRANPIPVVVVSRTGGWDEFLCALRQGAFDYLVLPPRLEEVKRVLGLALRETPRSNEGATTSLTTPAATASRFHFDLEDPWLAPTIDGTNSKVERRPNQ